MRNTKLLALIAFIISLIALVSVLSGCKKEVPQAEQKFCFACQISRTEMGTGSATETKVTSKEYCDYNQAQINAVEQNGTGSKQEYSFDYGNITVQYVTKCSRK